MPDNKQQLTGLKKRQQITSANKLIFIWVIAAAIALSMFGVAAQFLFRQAAFNQKIITAKAKTQSTLSQNIDNAAELKRKVDGLLADQNLAKVKADPNDSTLKVVLDALPTTEDPAGLASSLQQVILPKSGVSVTELSTIAQTGESSIVEEAVTETSAKATSFTFGASGSYEQMKNMLNDMERTIRPMDIRTLSLEGSDATLRVSVHGVTYYLPERSVELGKRTIKP